MSNLLEYSNILNFMYPVFSGLTCAMLLFFSIGSSLTQTEINIKRITIVYLLMATFNWIATFIYGYFPELFPYINVLTLACYIYAMIFLYWVFHILTRTDDSQRFSPWHHLLPVTLCGVLLVWSCFVPYSIQLEIVKGRGAVFPEGYEAYGRYFTSKPLIRFIFTLVYTVFIIARLARYYRKVNTCACLVRRPARWVIFLSVLIFTMLITAGIGALMPRMVAYTSVLPKVAALSIFCQHILLTYHIMCRDFMLYITFPGRQHEPFTDRHHNTHLPQKPVRTLFPLKVVSDQKTADTLPPGRTYFKTGNVLTRRELEAYMSKYKPFLDPGFSLTDLVEVTGINRSYVSGFINKVYKVNFNRYINSYRLKELERLTRLSSNAGKSLHDLVCRAGFSGYKHYIRAKAMEDGTIKVKAKKPEDE